MKAPITLKTKGRLKSFGGGWGEGNWDCATDAAGSMDISKGNSNFIVYLDSIWFGQVVAFGHCDCEKLSRVRLRSSEGTRALRSGKRLREFYHDKALKRHPARLSATILHR